MALRVRDGETVLDRLRQEGCLKARFPRPPRGGWLEAVTLNSSGGVAGGDVLNSTIEAGPGARVAVCGQAAERFYRALPGSTARVRTRIAVAAGAAVEWLPQETILFDRSALDRRLTVDLAEDAWFVGVETLVFGRQWMGEMVRALRLRDVIRVERAGGVVLHDAVRLDGDAQAALDRAAVAGGARVVATVVHAAVDARERLEAVRAALEAVRTHEPPSPHPLPPAGKGFAGAPVLLPRPLAGEGRGEGGASLDAGASAWNGLLVARVVAADSACARAAIVAALAAIRGARPLPRLWSC